VRAVLKSLVQISVFIELQSFNITNVSFQILILSFLAIKVSLPLLFNPSNSIQSLECFFRAREKSMSDALPIAAG